MQHKEEFEEWINDGNVIKFNNGYSTQCSQYQNRFKTKLDLYKYFVNQVMY